MMHFTEWFITVAALIYKNLPTTKPVCILCNKSYDPSDGMFGECRMCAFGFSDEAIDRHNSSEHAQMFSAETMGEFEYATPPLFEPKPGLSNFTFGADGDGNVAVRQINEYDEETWEYIGHDGFEI